MGILAIMGKSGDDKVAWDMKAPETVRAAAEAFDTHRRRGYLAYTVKGGDGASVSDGAVRVQGEIIKAFDPAAEQIVLIPPLVGGAPMAGA